MINWHDENQVKQLRKQVADLAKDVLSKKVCFLEGVRGLCSLSSEFKDSERFNYFNLFIAIDSETDHLPVGSVRQLWDAEALIRADKEARECESFYQAQFKEACSDIIEKFG